jgi:uncharacterized membrane protein YeiH
MLFDAIDLGATFVFAISGATQGVRHRLDLFGVLVVAWAAAVAGGLARDLLIGAVPPAAISDWRYLAAAAAAGLIAFFASDPIGRLRRPITCIGGGVARDLLTLQVPRVLHSELYAVAALAGAGSLAFGYWLGLPHMPVALFAAALCLFLRLMAVYRGWHLPRAGATSPSSKETD